MKKLILSIAILAAPLLAEAKDVINLDQPGQQIPMPLNERAIAVDVLYPGARLGKICAISISATSYIPHSMSISRLISALKITEARGGGTQERRVDILSIDFARVPLVLDTYIDRVLVRTRDGSTLGQTIARTLGATRSVTISAAGCPGR